MKAARGDLGSRSSYCGFMKASARDQTIGVDGPGIGTIGVYFDRRIVDTSRQGHRVDRRPVADPRLGGRKTETVEILSHGTAGADTSRRYCVYRGFGIIPVTRLDVSKRSCENRRVLAIERRAMPSTRADSSLSLVQRNVPQRLPELRLLDDLRLWRPLPRRLPDRGSPGTTTARRDVGIALRRRTGKQRFGAPVTFRRRRTHRL